MDLAVGGILGSHILTYTYAKRLLYDYTCGSAPRFFATTNTLSTAQ